MGLGIVSCPQRVCCCWKDIWTSFCWGLGAAVSHCWPEQAAVLPVSTCTSEICLLRSSSQGEPSPHDLRQSWALLFPETCKSFPSHLSAPQCHHQETLDGQLIPWGCQGGTSCWDISRAHSALRERSRLWFTGLILMRAMWPAFYISTHSYQITSEHVKPCSWTLLCKSSDPWGSLWDGPKSIGNWRLRDEMCSGKQGKSVVFSCTWEKMVLGWRTAVVVFCTSVEGFILQPDSSSLNEGTRGLNG